MTYERRRRACAGTGSVLMPRGCVSVASPAKTGRQDRYDDHRFLLMGGEPPSAEACTQQGGTGAGTEELVTREAGQQHDSALRHGNGEGALSRSS